MLAAHVPGFARIASRRAHYIFLRNGSLGFGIYPHLSFDYQRIYGYASSQEPATCTHQHGLRLTERGVKKGSMDNKIKFFDETFKVLLSMTVCAWALYVVFVFFVGDSEGCVSGTPGWLITILAWTVGILSAPPLIYGLARLLFWPNGPKDKSVWASGWIVSAGVGIFIAAVILFAIGLSQFGCQ